MNSFKPLELEDKDIIESYLKNYNSNSYEYLFSSLYIWRNVCDIKYSIIDNSLIIQRTEENKGTFFMQPIGYNKDRLYDLILKLRDLSNNIENMNYFFGDIEESFLKDLYSLEDKFSFNIVAKDDVDDFEYIYNTKDLINLKGKNYHTKRNHYNSFKRLYNYEIKDTFNISTINEDLSFIDNWKSHKIIETTELFMEKLVILDALKSITSLNLKPFFLYSNNELIGISIGELVRGDLAIIHFEIANTSYSGVYSFINKEFLSNFFSSTSLVNREEDSGDIGLRTAKKSYHPILMLKKYLVTFIR